MVFRRIRGRIVPIAESTSRKVTMINGARRAAIAAPAVFLKEEVKPHNAFKFAGLATAVASGVVAGATLFGVKGKKFIAAQALSTGLDFGSTALNVSAYAGKGKLKQRAESALKQEAVNIGAGYAALGASVLATKAGREATMKGLRFVGKALRIIK